jgi:ribosomal protein S18 acetylase RimI-like enzyme
MLSLRPITQEEYDVYLTESVERLAEELAKSYDLASEEARKAAHKSFARLLPRGTPNEEDHHINVLLDGEQRVGILWFSINRDRQPPEAYVWDLIIDPAHQRLGNGKRAMTSLEEEVRKLRVPRIVLNVFEHNSAARNWYESIGYRTVSRLLVKRIEPVDEAT